MTRWRKAEDAAWRAFGTRYWRLIVGGQMLLRSLSVALLGVAVAALIWGCIWLWRHGATRTHTSSAVWWWLSAGSLLTAASVTFWRFWHPTASRTGARLVAVLVVAGALFAVIAWRA